MHKTIPTPSRENSRGWHWPIAALVLLAWTGHSAWGDSISIRPADASPSSPPTVYSEVSVDSLRDGKITFSNNVQEHIEKDYLSVVDISLDGEPMFNQAQQDFAAGRLEQSIEEFAQAMRSPGRQWLKSICFAKIVQAAKSTGHADRAARAFIGLVQTDSETALLLHSPPPGKGASGLGGAAASLSRAAESSDLAPSHLRMLLTMLLEVDQARADSGAIRAVSQQLTDLGPDSDPSEQAWVSTTLANARLTQATISLEQGDIVTAEQTIESSGTMFVDPPQEAEALYILAEAKQRQAKSSGQPPDWQDAAIAYLRVAADFKSAPGSPRVADSLLHAAQILEKLNEPGKALDMYQTIVSDYPESAAATAARQSVQRLAPSQSKGS